MLQFASGYVVLMIVRSQLKITLEWFGQFHFDGKECCYCENVNWGRHTLYRARDRRIKWHAFIKCFEDLTWTTWATLRSVRTGCPICLQMSRNKVGLDLHRKLGKLNLISRLSSRVTREYGAGGRILLYNLYFPKKNYWWQFLYYQQKGYRVMLLTCVLDVSKRK
jgi:ribosomal protein L44E